MATLGELEEELCGYYLLHAIRGDLLRRSGHSRDAYDAFTEVMDRTSNRAEKAFLTQARQAITPNT